MGWSVPVLEAVPDEADEFRHVSELADSGSVAAIFTTGGTGIALRDVTPGQRVESRPRDPVSAS
jgi:molybdopterin biosynthesis enzyme MoaB